MNFVFYFALFISIFQSFLCIPMDQPTKRSTPKKYLLQDNNTLVFPTPIPAELQEYFPSDIKAQLPQKSSKKIAETCLQIRNAEKKKEMQTPTKDTSSLVVPTAEPKKLKPQIQQEMEQKQKESEESDKKRKETRKRIIEYQKSLAIRKKEEKALSPQQNKQNKLDPQKAYFTGITLMMKQRGLQHIGSLKIQLTHLCNDILSGKTENNVLKGPYFDKKRIILFGPINSKISYSFTPELQKIFIIDKPYHTDQIKTESYSSESEGSDMDTNSN